MAIQKVRAVTGKDPPAHMDIKISEEFDSDDYDSDDIHSDVEGADTSDGETDDEQLDRGMYKP